MVLKEKKLSFKITKKKPTIAGTSTAKNIKISRYYSKKDFGLAKKAISEMQKSKWSSALNIAKKAKDKSIYNFIQWRHLLTSGNQASFYEYQVFLNKNSDYPRIDRIRYLAEHKLSTESVSPKKIINWFGEKDPLSGYGKMILGESYILIGNKNTGIKLIKEGWITADLSKNELRYFRKKYKNIKTLYKIQDFLVKNNCDRQVNIIALGGGVIGDLVGLAADLFLRGVNLIHIPTTLFIASRLINRW